MLRRDVLITCLAMRSDFITHNTLLRGKQFAQAEIATLVTCRWSPMVRWIEPFVARLEPSHSVQMRACWPRSRTASTIHRVRCDGTETLTDPCLS